MTPALESYIVSPAEQVQRYKDVRARLFKRELPIRRRAPIPSTLIELKGFLNLHLFAWTIKDKAQFQPVNVRKSSLLQLQNWILRKVAADECLDASEILSERRAQIVVQARHIVAYLCVKSTPWSTTRVGRFLGDRDHSTICNSVAKIIKRRAASPEFDARIKRYQDEIELMKPQVSTGSI